MHPDQMPVERNDPDPRDVNDIKLAINNLIWMHAPPGTSLNEAENRACQILDIILKDPS